jgi:predicted methyltransferase
LETQAILSHYQAETLLSARAQGQGAARCSLYLGISSAEVALSNEGVQAEHELSIPWDWIETIAEDQNACFTLTAEGPQKVKTFSQATSRPISLFPTSEAPTLLIAGLPMHRIKGTTPNRDTEAKVKAVKPIRGRVLDTCTGLGYSAILAAKTVEQVVTIELDPAVLEIARQNPWSQELFTRKNIEQLLGDSFDVIEEMEAEQFSVILHDPPTMSLAGHLYSQDFYAELWRVLRPGGRLFHYVGDPKSKSGSQTTNGVMRRLEQAKFTAVRRRPRAFGVSAQKAS